MTENSKQLVVFTPLPKSKKISDMTREELLDLARSIRGAVTPNK